MSRTPQPRGGSLAKKRILLAVTGSIAAYKAPLLLRLLKRAGAHVEVVLTTSAQKFIGAATFSGLGARVHDTLWTGAGEPQVELARAADALVVFPATADTLARLAQGRADDLLTAAVLCSEAPLFLAPAMHPAMWSHAATQDNVRALRQRGAHFVGPAHGEVASGDTGEGRLEEPENMLAALEAVLAGPGLLAGKKIVVTAGPTREPLDPVRSLTNLSTGKMGFAIAEQAARQGADVRLISGPVSLATPPLVRRIPVETTAQMQAALAQQLGPDLSQVDALVMAAAVCDYRPAHPSTQKLKRDGQTFTQEFVPNPDLLQEIGLRRKSSHPLLVGFALETAPGDALINLGRKKLLEKRADLIVANRVEESLGREESRVYLITAKDCRPLDLMPKIQVAAHLVEWIAQRLQEPVQEHSA